MSLPTDSQWARYSALCARLQAVPAAERGAVLRALRAEGHEDPQVLSLVALHWALPPDPDRTRTGERLGDFTLEEPLGAGGMGVVYRAQQHIGSTTRPVAVKLIHPTLLYTARDEALARFRAEIDTLVKLEHAGIARIYGGGIAEDPRTHEPLPYLAMELVRGGLPITAYAREYAVPWPERLGLLLRVCRAVQYAHEHRVIHRDLKPANILVDREGAPFVIDFGLAHACDALLPGAHRAASGTPAYMSPEQVSEAFGPISAKSDVYALGLILYELLTGQPPYRLPRDGTYAQWCRVITEVPPPPLPQSSAVDGGELEAIVAAALAKRPADRVRVDVLRARLERYLQRLPPDSDRPAPDPRQLPRDPPTVARHDHHVIAPVPARPPRAADLLPSLGSAVPRPPATPTLDQTNAVSSLASGPSVSPPAAPPVPPPVPRSEATMSEAPSAAARATPADEWRPLTVLACQLIHVSEPATPRDPEARLEVVRAYHAMATEVVRRFDGHLAQAQGERLLVYFGYPQAHEEDARRAVLTGFGLVEGMATLNKDHLPNHGGRLAVQVGMHTGVELVGTIGGGDQRTSLAVGETPSMAAGLQRLAAPDTVVISPATWRLVEGYVACEVLGTYQLDDLAAPLTVYRAVQESPAHTRLEAAIRRGLTPLVGREHELGLLHEAWAQATEGQGQVVVLRGEAGIGKSRLVQEFTSHLTGKPYTRFECHGSPYYQHTAFYPVVTGLQRLLQFRPEETADARLRKLEGLLERSGIALHEAVPLWAALLSLPLPAHYPPLTLTPEYQRQKTFEALLAWLLQEAERQPVVMFVEDLHWADASTVEWLTLLIDQVPTACLLLLLVCRAEFPLPWAARAHLSQVTLRRLSRPQVETMVQRLTDKRALPAVMLHHLVATTDGVPLFVEESTKMMLESGFVEEREGRYELAGPVPALAIPATLHDSLMARLDRLGSTKQVAQLGAVLGREFSYEVLQAVASVEEATLRQALAQLVDAELLYQRGLPPQARYTFKHVLIQEAAYQSLLRSTRRHYHQQIAQVLETQFSDTRETHPELLAHHYTEAGLSAQAIPYWQQAGQHAIERSAHVEALSHFTKGLELLKALPEVPERIQQELTMQLALGSPLLMIKGHTAPEVEHTYSRALFLCQQVGDSPQRFSALVGLWRFYLSQARLQTAYELGTQCFAFAQSAHNTALLLEAHMIMGSTLLFLGDLVSARKHLEQGITFYSPQRNSLLAFSRGIDPGVTCLARASWTLWMLGYPDQALIKSHEALQLAQKLSHAYSLAFAQQLVVALYRWRREAPLVQEQAETLISFSDTQGFVQFHAGGMIRRGWALAEQGLPAEGIVELRQGLSIWRTLGLALGLPDLLAMLAEAYGKNGQAEEGLEVVTEALAVVHKTAECYYEAELHRIRGELLLQRHTGAKTHALSSRTEAEKCFCRAIKISQHRKAKSLELRATVSLSRLWQQGKRAEAHQMLAKIYGWFTEGFDTPDLQEAKTLLVTLVT